MKQIYVLVVFFFFLNSGAFGQVLYPTLEGEELLQAIQADYTPNLPLSYAQARDTLYANIDSDQDSIHAIYTDFTVYLPPNQDPTAALFSAGINTEHIYPQGRGATDGTPPHRNMHNLAPARVDVNQARGNLPFAEIPDNQTDVWYVDNTMQQSIPSQNIDAYSESTNFAFEPRESVKGDMARAVFYIHAIYRDQVQAVDATFFSEQQADLCAWHFQDPADANEKTRSQQIAAYQDGKENPFVIDCTLAQRLYCQSYDCFNAVDDFTTPSINVYFNATSQALIVKGELAEVNKITIFSSDGRALFSESLVNNTAEELQFKLSPTSGLYFSVIQFENGTISYYPFLIL